MISNFNEIKHQMTINDLIKSMNIIDEDLKETLSDLQWRQHRLVCEIKMELIKRDG